MHWVWSQTFSRQRSCTYHVLYLLEKTPYCSKFTLFKTRFLSLAHFYLLHKIGYATPWCLFYLQKTNDRHWYAIVGFSRPVSHIRLLTVRQLINWTFNIDIYQFSNARVVSKGVWSLKTVTILWSHGHNLTVMKLCRCQCTRKM